MTRARSTAGFTLIELMIALGILAAMATISVVAIRQFMQAREKYGAIHDRYREARVAMARIVNDLSMAYISKEDRSVRDTRTFFIGDSEAKVDQLRFSTLAHRPFGAHVHESDQTVVQYFSARDRKDRDRTNLIRRETRRTAPEPLDQIPGVADVLFHDIEALELRYWDPRKQEWREEWNTQNSDGELERVPDRVEITIEFKDERDETVRLTTSGKVFMQEQLVMHEN